MLLYKSYHFNDKSMFSTSLDKNGRHPTANSPLLQELLFWLKSP